MPPQGVCLTYQDGAAPEVAPVRGAWRQRPVA